ncbi:MAG: VWA domain-containing protein [Polyangiales bacterium]
MRRLVRSAWPLVLGAIVALAIAPWASRESLPFALPGLRGSLLAPRFLFLLAALPPVLGAAVGSLVERHVALRIASAVFRLVALAAVVVALARPVRIESRTDVSVVYLVDVSASVPDEALARARAWVEHAYRSRGEARVAVVTFARHARRVPLPSDPDAPFPRFERPTPTAEIEETDVEQAIELAQGLLVPGTLRRVVIVSDGRETLGDLRAAAARARAQGIEIHARSLDDGAPKEVAVTAVELPDDLAPGAPFEIRTKLHATRAADVRIELFQGEVLNGLDSVRTLHLEPGENVVTFRSVVRVPGTVTYRAEIAVQGGDRFPGNDRMEVAAVVPGRPTVLYVEGSRGHESYLARALSAAELEVEVRTPRGFPVAASELERFDFVVVSDVPAEALSPGQVAALERYVEGGGGFLMAGGEQGFGLGGWQGTAMERLLPVRMDAERRRDQPTLALALVIDRSGSMAGQKIELAKEAARATASLLGSEDALEVVGFDAAPERIVRMQSAGNRIGIDRDIGRMAARGGTAIFPALDLAYQDLSVTRARIKHVILLTDGQSPEEGIAELVQVMRAEGMTVSTVGLGADVNRSLLATVASQGGGRSYFTNDPSSVPRIFVRETSQVARSQAVEELVRARVVSSAAFLRGVDFATAPFLHGYVATRPRARPAEVILETDLGEPLLARMRVGLGTTLAFTSDVKNRWAVEWVSWSGFSRLFAQLVREHMRQDRSERLPMTAETVGEEARVVVDAIGEDDEFLDDLVSTAEVETADGEAVPGLPSVPLPLRHTAPGRYELRFPLEAPGSFVVAATHRRGGRAVAQSRATLSRPYPGEYRVLAPDREVLASVTRLSGGTLDGPARAPFEARSGRVEAPRDAFAALLGLALLAFLLDLAARRLPTPGERPRKTGVREVGDREGARR